MSDGVPMPGGLHRGLPAARRSARRLPEGALRWAASFVLILALHVGAAAWLLTPQADIPDGGSEDAIEVDMTSDSSDPAEKPDEVAGPDVPDTANPTSEKSQAQDPDPPAPDAPAPTEVKRQPEAAAPEATAPPSPAEGDAALPPPTQAKPDPKPEDRPPEEAKPVDAKEDTVERKTAPSQASEGSVALLGGGRRPSATAMKTWRGAVGKHLARNRRYPAEARSLGMQGTAQVRVTIDGDGHVTDRKLVKSSGRSLLDGEALAMTRRADPLPKPPPGLPIPIVLTVPVNFAIR